MEKEIIEKLARSVLFRGFSHSEIGEIVLSIQGVVQTVEKGTRLVEEGDPPSHAGIVLEGSLHAVKTYRNGANNIMDYVYPSMVYGLDMLLTTTKTSSLAIESIMQTRILTFPFPGLHAFDVFDGETKMRLYENIMNYLANENIRKQRKVEIVSQSGLRDRIWTYLGILYVRKHAAGFTIPFSREQLADYLCVNRSALSHELSLMRKEGLIDFKKNAFVILDLSHVQNM
ncbi:Crp/Fnr family transcriptional regulator [Christensenellaceae bacterium OttesenSCG-928-M15]|nr:Crp/Fnr family transcriptional regulator [Christensenellaceae bacterium OttesenSCG-928-M15]